MAQVKVKPFLKWAGNKYRVIDKIFPNFPEHTRLVEPFMGAGSFAVNRIVENYLGSDINADLINVFNCLSEEFIEHVREFFSEEYFGEEIYYEMRNIFNQETISPFDKASIFIYLNKYGFNGLCRYNRHGKFTTPFNKAKKPATFPEIELKHALSKKNNACFKCQSYENTFLELKKGDLVYCDPPYLPEQNKEGVFTIYSGNEFSILDHQKLVNLAEKCRANSIPVIISNHSSTTTKELYKNASKIVEFSVSRSMGRYENFKNNALELLAIYD
ncbi:MAG: Dam family site-specific DNA-(adenine-N6)-methyltransferase [Candidatus Nitrosotenuis sp.]